MNKNEPHTVRRHRVLIMASACHPLRGSEMGVSWAWLCQIAEHYDIHVITASRWDNQEVIKRMQDSGSEGLKRAVFHYLTYIDPRNAVEAFFLHKIKPCFYHKYALWMRKANVLAVKLHKEEPFDLCHMLGMIGYREPSYFYELGIPFVWGPIGGTQDVPYAFLSQFGVLHGFENLARNLVNRWQIRFSSRVRRAIRSASGLISVSSDTRDIIRSLYGRDSKVVLVSPTDDHNPQASVKRPGDKLNLVFSGYAIARKNLPAVLEALAQPNLPKNWSLTVLGGGPLTGKWQRMAKNFHLMNKITWVERLPKEDAIKRMSECDVFVFPSLQEGSPGVVSEAISLGLPVICLNLHGQADMIDDTCGIRIDAKNPKQVMRDLSEHIALLCRNPELVTRLSEGALARAKQFTVSAQYHVFLEAYEAALKNHKVATIKE